MYDTILLAALACCSGFVLFSVGGIILHTAETSKLLNKVTLELLIVAFLSGLGALFLYPTLNVRTDETTINYWIGIGLSIGFLVIVCCVFMKAQRKISEKE